MNTNTAKTRGMVKFIEGLLARLARASSDRPYVALTAIALACILSIAGARNLRLDANLTHLLPKSFDSVKGIEALEKRFGSVGFITVVGQYADGKALKRFADDTAPLIEALDNIRYVDKQRPSTFFEDRAFYFLDLPDLKTVQKRMAAREKYERQQRNPMYLNLEETEPPSLDFSKMIERYKSRSDRQWVQQQSNSDYYLDEKEQMIVILARPTKRSSDLAYTSKLVNQVREIIAGINTKKYGPNFKISLAGRFVKNIDQQVQIESDLKVASALAFLLVLLYLAMHFRRISAVALLIAPLLIGLIWTFGFTGYFYDTLNLLTGFVGAILTGLGIDHGIHLLGRYDAERAEGRPWQEAIEYAFGHTGRAVVVAGLTTAVAFAALTISEFRAFREFGVIAAAGIFFVIVSYAVVLPALLGITSRFDHARASRKEFSLGTYGYFLSRFPKAIFWTGLLVAGGLALNAGKSSFDYDFAALQDSNLPSFILDKATNRILGYSQTPVIVLTADIKSEQAAALAIRHRQEKRGKESTIDFVAAVSDLVPSQQPAKFKVLKKINRTLKRVKSKWLDKQEDKDMLKKAKRMTRTPPYTRSSLPAEVRRQFQGPQDTPNAGFVLIFPGISLSDGEAVLRFADEMRGTTDAPIAGEAMILADILAMLKRDAPVVLALTLGLGLLTLWLLLGSLYTALICFGAALLSILATVGLLPMLGIEFNYLSVIALPVLFGLGVDGAVHMLSRFEEGGHHGHAFGETGRAVSGAVLTTVFGFGAMLIANHPGLNSFGTLAVLGLGVNLIVSLLIVPAFLLISSPKGNPVPPAVNTAVLPELMVRPRKAKTSIKQKAKTKAKSKTKAKTKSKVKKRRTR